MDKNKALQIIADSAQNRTKMHIEFSREVSIPIHKKFKSVKEFNAIFFEIDGADPNDPMRFGYKIRRTDMTGYKIERLPIDLIESMVSYDDMVDIKQEKDKMLSWILRNKERDIWPNLEKDFDTMVQYVNRAEITRKYYLKSKLNIFGMARVSEIFDKRENGTHLIDDNCYIETSQRENGYFAWLVDHETTWILINPRVAILRRRSL